MYAGSCIIGEYVQDPRNPTRPALIRIIHPKSLLFSLFWLWACVSITLTHFKSQRLIRITHSHDYSETEKFHDHPELPGQEWPAFPSPDSTEYPESDPSRHGHLVLLTHNEFAAPFAALAHLHLPVAHQGKMTGNLPGHPDWQVTRRILRPPRGMQVA